MACIFKRSGTGPWRIAYVDWDPKTGKKRRREKSTGTRDKAIAAQMAARLEEQARRHRQDAEDLAELRRRGLIDPVAERLADESRKLLASHLDDHEAILVGKGNTAKYIRLTLADCREVMDACGYEYPADLCPVKLARYVAALKADGRSARTINRKLAAIRGFSRWLCMVERIRTDPLLQVRKLNIRSDRRLIRRALSEDEIARLIEAAENGPDVFGMSGADRAMLYRVAVGTGLRAAELRSLTPQSFALADLDRAKVAVEAAYSKHRRRDVLPIRRDLAESVARFIEGKPPKAPLFPTLPEKTAKMMRVDLDNAKPWIPYRDATGKVADFHALRVTFITRLARAGVTPAVAKSLARHSTIMLTLDVYTDVGESDERAALSKLPALPGVRADSRRDVRTTGT